MNRVKEYYELAGEYLSVSIYGRYLIATHFRLVGEDVMASNRDEMDRIVFLGVAKKEIFDQFKKFVQQYKKIEASRESSSSNHYVN